MKNSKIAPKWVLKANSTIETLKAKRDKSSYDFVRLVNAQSKIEDKSLSKVFKRVNQLPEKAKKGILGNSKFPIFKDFKELAPDKEYFSLYDGLMILRKFNKSEIRQNRAKKQTQIQLKKVA